MRQDSQDLDTSMTAAEDHDRLFGREAERQAREDAENYFLWCSMEDWERFASAGLYRTESE